MKELDIMDIKSMNGVTLKGLHDLQVAIVTLGEEIQYIKAVLERNNLR